MKGGGDMVLSKQQKYFKAVIESLGYAREDQLIELFRPAFCPLRPDKAEEIATSALHGLLHCDNTVRQTGKIYHTRKAKVSERILEAIDVMLELSVARPLSFQAESPPILLRFSIQEKKVRVFIVAEHGAQLPREAIGEHDRIVLLFDAQGQAQPLSVSNKQFFAARQGDGSHRFYAANSQ